MSSTDKKQTILLQPHEFLKFSTPTTLWRVEAGALRIDCGKTYTDKAFVRMALPGDILGVERWIDAKGDYSIQAVTPTRLVPYEVAASDMHTLLVQAFATNNHRYREAMSLRTGKVAERLQRLMLLLSPEQRCAIDTKEDYDLPSLADMAEIIDSTKETISRVLGSMKRLNFVQERRPLGIKFSRADLVNVKLRPGMSASSAAEKVWALR